MIGFLIFGGFWFWTIFTIISFVLILNVIFSDKLGWIWFSGIVMLVLFILSGGIPFAWMFANPLTTLMWAGIYIAAGLLWSIKEWYSYVVEKAKYYTSDSSMLYRGTDTKEDLIKELNRDVDIKRHWDDITTWIVYFPYFVLAWALTDPIKKLAQQFTFVYEKISSVLVNKTVNKIIAEREANANTKGNTGK
jgi:hypothetical protein